MTTEEKAKAYDEALERARKAYNAIPTESRGARKIIEDAFPELRESEGERIRKALICGLSEGLSEHNWQGFGGATIDECLAYLEKQKEPHYTKRNAIFDKCVENCDPEVMKEVSNKVDEMLGKEQKPSCWNSPVMTHEMIMNEQKPAECIEDSVKFEEGFKAGRESGIRDGQKYVLDNAESYGLCKHAEWSEEDERMLDAMIDIVSGSLYEPLCPRKEMLAWLKSLRPQSKQEWSEEDKNKIESIKGLITMGRFADTNTIRTIWELLDSLRPSWKPSEEQMTMLRAIINDPNNAGAESCHLAMKSLYEQLKKLM